MNAKPVAELDTSFGSISISSTTDETQAQRNSLDTPCSINRHFFNDSVMNERNEQRSFIYNNVESNNAYIRRSSCTG